MCALILSGSQGYCEIIAYFNPNSFKKDSEEKAQDQTSGKVAESAGPEKTEILAEKSAEKKEESNRGNGTRGNYIGISVNRNQLNFHEEYSAEIPSYGYYESVIVKPSASKYGIGAGLTYKYAINFHDFFIAPGAFFEKNWTSVNANEKAGINSNKIQRLDIDSRYGVTADLGYDFTNKFATYLMGGYSVVRYTAKNGAITPGGDYYETILKKSSNGSLIVGLGTKYNYSDHVSFNVEANTQKFNLKNNGDVPIVKNAGYIYDSRFVGRFNTLKIGASYNF